MIDLHYWTTPNGHKITMFLEETGLAYKIFPVNIGKGEQFKADFLAISPNNRIPALLDHEPKGGGKPISVFETGAMLVYLAEKSGKFLPESGAGRYEVMQWLFWQMGGLGPMAGQNNHFKNYAVEKLPYAIDRYLREVNRLYGVLDRRLADREFVAGDYSIADMACYPWIVPWERQGQNLDDVPSVKRWFNTIKARPATVRAYAWVPKINPGQGGIRTEEERRILFGQTAAIGGRGGRQRGAVGARIPITRKLYDLAGADPDLRFSPYCWRSKLALAHKGLNVETIPWRFTDKDVIGFSGQGRVPVLIDGETVVWDSWTIANYLEDTYPDRPSLFGGPGGRALARFVNSWADAVQLSGMIRLLVADIHAHVHEKDRGYFRESREKRFGATLEQVAADREQRLPAFRQSLDPLRLTLRAQPFLAGEEPAYADYIVMGGFQWARCISPFKLLEADDPVAQWRERMLQSLGGLPGRAVGYAA